MDSFNFDVRVEKANAIRNHRRIQKLAELLRRVVEITLALALVVRVSLGNLFASENPFGYLKIMYATLFSSWFVFVIGNIIVLTLFVKSGHFSYEDYAQKQENVSYKATIENSSNGLKGTMVVSNPVEDMMKLSSETRCLAVERCKEDSIVVYGVKELPSAPEDTMSNEEFRCTVEAFIERQKKIIREEN